MMDASLMIGEMVEKVMGETTCRSLPETSYGKKVLQLGKQKKSPLSDLVFQSIVNQEKLIEDSFEKSHWL